MTPKNPPSGSPTQPDTSRTAETVARTFFGVGPDQFSRRRAILRLLVGAVESAVVVPLIFYLKFGEIGSLGWGTTLFFVVYCLLAAAGLYFLPRREYHTPIPLRGDWADRLGAFWLVSCAFGPFFAWIISAAIPLRLSTWRWSYGLQVFLAAGLPLLTALPLTRYLRGKATWVALPILLVVTSLPVMSAVNTGRDLWEGPVVRHIQPVDRPGETLSELYLQHTQRVIEDGRQFENSAR